MKILGNDIRSGHVFISRCCYLLNYEQCDCSRAKNRVFIAIAIDDDGIMTDKGLFQCYYDFLLLL